MPSSAQPHGKSRFAFQALGFCKRRRLPAAGTGAAAPSLFSGADSLLLLAAAFFCAGDAAAAGVATVALPRLVALALCLGVGNEAGVAARASMRASSGVTVGVSTRGVAARGVAARGFAAPPVALTAVRPARRDSEFGVLGSALAGDGK